MERGRGLKLAQSHGLACRSSLWRGGRGLKPQRHVCRHTLTSAGRRSSLWRGAWIETSRLAPSAPAPQVAPLYGEGRGLKRDTGTVERLPAHRRSSLWRGAWIETRIGSPARSTALIGRSGRSSLWRGAWIETDRRSSVSQDAVSGLVRVAPLYGEGRGLKRWLCDFRLLRCCRSSLWRGAWIETSRCLRLRPAR